MDADGIRHIRLVRRLNWPVFLWLLLALAPTAALSPETLQTESLEAFAARLHEAARAEDREAVRAGFASPADAAWFPGPRSPFREAWGFAAAEVPASSAKGMLPVGVFYCYQPCEGNGDRVYLLERTEGGYRIGKELRETETQGIRIRDHDLKLTFRPAVKACDVEDQVLVEKVGKLGPVCYFRLSGDMRVSSAGPLEAKALPGIVVIRPPKEKRFWMRLRYSGVVDHRGDYINEREAVLVSYWYPHVGRLPATAGFTVTAPKTWTAVAQGELLSRREEGEQAVTVYRNDIPTCYFSLDAGPYKATQRKVGDRTYTAFQLRENAAAANRALDQLASSLTFFEERFGPFPYTHYDLVQTLGPFPGALEAYSFSTYSGGYGAVVHEVAHTWWGGVVPNTYLRSLWNESFAVYSDNLYRRMTGPNRDRKRALAGLHLDRQHGRSLIQQYAVPLSEARDALNPRHSAAGYGKGAQVMAMLEDLIGQEKLVRSMRRFRESVRPGEAKEWGDFERIVRRVAGRDYGWFFRQWLERPGVPVVKVVSARAKARDGEHRLEVVIEQEGDPYRLPRVPLVIEGAEGEKTEREIDLLGANSRIVLAVPFKPRRVMLDPEGNLLLAGSVSAGDNGDPLRLNVAP